MKCLFLLFSEKRHRGHKLDSCASDNAGIWLDLVMCFAKCCGHYSTVIKIRGTI